MRKPHPLALGLLGIAMLGVIGSALAADKLRANDWSWMEKVARADAAEIQAGQLASNKAASPQVRAFAERMVADHTRNSEELKTLADSKGVTLPREPDSAHKKMVARLEKYKGAQFDEAYIERAGVRDHHDAIKLFKSGIANVYDPDIKTFAQNTLPTIQHHYEMAHQMEMGMQQ